MIRGGQYFSSCCDYNHTISISLQTVLLQTMVYVSIETEPSSFFPETLGGAMNFVLS